MSPIFSEQDIQNAKNYKYQGTDRSIIGRLFMRHYWEWMMRFCPMSVAPNTITILGLVFELVSFAISYFLSEGFAQPIPNWACVMNGVSLFCYQTLDSMDGKQARRTGSSSPMG
jgi:ethanolaminephosphotransferase